MRASRLTGLVAAAAVALSLVACSGNAAPENTTGLAAPNPAKADAFPVEIEHAFGTTTVEEKPERIASVAWSNHEVPLALGVQPVIFEKATWGDADGDGMLPWVADKVKELGFEPNMYDPTDGIDFQAVADSDPDVIIASYSGLTQEEYDKLSKIAPTVAFPEVAWGTTYTEMIELNAKAMGLEVEGEKLIADLDKTVKDSLAKHADIEGKKALFAFLDAADYSTVGYYSAHDTRPKFLADYGLPFPALASDAAAASPEFYQTVSAEEIEKFDDVDVIVTYGDPSTLAGMQADPLLSKIPAIAEGRVLFAGAEGNLDTAVNPSPLSIPSTIDTYFTALQKALAGNK